MNADTPTDEQLMTQFYGCDNEALTNLLPDQTSLYGRHNTRLFNYAKKRLRDWEIRNEESVAETVLNRTWIRVFQTKDKPSSRWKEERGRFKPWLHTILWRECARAARDEGGQPGQLDDPDTRPGPEPKTDSELESMQPCIDALTNAQREVIIMKFWDGMKQTEIAELLDIGEPAIANRLTAARESLKECLQQHGFGPEDLN